MGIYRNIDRSILQFDFMVHNNSTHGHFDDEILSMGGRIYKITPRKQGFIANIRELNKFFSEHRYKIIHAHLSSLSYVEPFKIAKKYGVPHRIVHSHSTKQGGGRFHRYLHALNKLSINAFATDFFSCSQLAAKWMFPKEIYLGNKYKVIRNAIEVKKYAYNPRIRDNKRIELGIQDKFVVGHVGRFHPLKNHVFIIDIFKQIKKLKSDSILMLVGDGDLKGKIETYIKENELEDSVVLTGVRNDVNELLQAMDIMIFPSLYEGFPLILVEAQTAGLPCVISRTITEEVKITDLVTQISLDYPPEYWANIVLEIINKYSREDKSDHIKSLGFDIEDIAQYMQNYYLKLIV